jgi:hypothetical protein
VVAKLGLANQMQQLPILSHDQMMQIIRFFYGCSATAHIPLIKQNKTSFL